MIQSQIRGKVWHLFRYQWSNSVNNGVYMTIYRQIWDTTYNQIRGNLDIPTYNQIINDLRKL